MDRNPQVIYKGNPFSQQSERLLWLSETIKIESSKIIHSKRKNNIVVVIVNRIIITQECFGGNFTEAISMVASGPSRRQSWQRLIPFVWKRGISPSANYKFHLVFLYNAMQRRAGLPTTAYLQLLPRLWVPCVSAQSPGNRSLTFRQVDLTAPPPAWSRRSTHLLILQDFLLTCSITTGAVCRLRL